MRSNKRRIYIGILLLAAVGAQGAKKFQVDLPFLINRGLLIYPELKKKHHDLRHAYLRKEEVNIKRLPDVRTEVYFNYLPYVDGKTMDVDWNEWSPIIRQSVTATLPLYSFGKLDNAEKAAEYNIEVKKAEIEETKASLQYQIKKIFWGYLFTNSLVKYILDKTIPKYEKVVNEREEEFKKGKIKRATLESAKINYYSLRKNEAEARQGLDESMMWIKTICGAAEEDQVEFAQDRLEPLNLDIKPFFYYLDLAKRYNHDMKKVYYGYMARKYYNEFQQSAGYPDLFLAVRGDYTYHSYKSETNLLWPEKSGNVGFVLGLRWDLSFWKHSNAQRQNDELFLGDLQKIKMGYKFQELEIRKVYEKMKEKKKQLVYSEQQFKAARRWLIFTINAYETGAGNVGDAQEGLTTLFYRQKDYYQAIYEFNLAIAAFEQILGIELVDYKKIFLAKSNYEDEGQDEEE